MATVSNERETINVHSESRKATTSTASHKDVVKVWRK
jgi:hypothetical protein